MITIDDPDVQAIGNALKQMRAVIGTQKAIIEQLINVCETAVVLLELTDSPLNVDFLTELQSIIEKVRKI